ncbi:type II toxin-antitoxin system RelE/ParE family toxin [Mucilaginibacter sp.]|uniref:type II toxin-antitoxin system RelE/ParE family toxin n=1 Tax=Mucilaginibacter sp. TaxID=1882438 RepID=UPI003B00459C
MYRAVILPLAKQDIKNAAEWYEEKQTGLGKRFIQEVRSKVSYIRSKPKATVVLYDDTRCAVLEVFPFMVHFTVDDSLKLVVVSAVFHTSLSTDRWAKR